MKRKFFSTLFIILSLLLFVSCQNNQSSDICETEITTEIDESSDTESITAAAENTSEIVSVKVSEIDFTQFKDKMSSNDYKSLETYFPVLSGNTDIIYQNSDDECKEINIYEFASYFKDDMELTLDRFTVLDLDNDGSDELIMGLRNNMGQYLILHEENGEYFAVDKPYRGFKWLQVNGACFSSGGASCSHCYELLFENGKFTEHELGHACSFSDNEYEINGESVSYDEYQLWHDEIMVGDAEWCYLSE